MRYLVPVLLLAACAHRTPTEAVEAAEQSRARQAERQDEGRSRRRAAAALHGAGNAFREAGTAPAAPPTYSCHADYLGGMTCDPR